MRTTAAVILIAASSAACGGGPSIPPAPTATPKPVCTLGKGVQEASCSRQASFRFGAQLDAAIDAVIKNQPRVFDLTREAHPGRRDYLVVDLIAYRSGVVANLQDAGYCAEADIFNDTRIKMKNVADFHEDYNVRSINYGDGSFIQWSGDAYDMSCSPAAFPLDRNRDIPPPDQRCGEPYPPEINNIGIKIQLQKGGVWTLDSTPQIRNNHLYCWDIGYKDGRDFCPVRAEGKADRVPCESWRIGIAKDTGRLGPTWTRDGRLCTGGDSGCLNHEYNSYHLYVLESDGEEHVYRACSDLDFCGEITIAH